MSLIEEIAIARKEIVADGYDMSFGELMNLYRDDEIVISPAFQRLFRWDESRKTRFIESLLLGIPIPPIFVFQREDGVWELIDGLQRLSTVFEFAGILKDGDGSLRPSSGLEGTKMLQSFANMAWESKDDGSADGIDKAIQLAIKRVRIRVEILRQDSDPMAKYELFQRLNTGGESLSDQEVRNSIAVMIDQTFYDWLASRAADANFLATICQTEQAAMKQSTMELALRYFAFRLVPYKPGRDVNEYLDDALVEIAQNIDRAREQDVFDRTFQLLNRHSGAGTFKKWDGFSFTGQFLMSVFEVVALGVSKNIDALESMGDPDLGDFIDRRRKELWADVRFTKNSGAGVRGTTRLRALLPIAEEYFRP